MRNIKVTTAASIAVLTLVTACTGTGGSSSGGDGESSGDQQIR